MPEGEKIEQRAGESDEHHGEADGVGVETLGEMPGRGGQDKRADANKETDSVKGDESAADALEEGEEEAGPVEPLEAGGGGSERFVAGDALRGGGFGHGLVFKLTP